MKITVRNGTTGPAHDPYGTEAVTVKRDDGTEVTHYSDGLGSVRVTKYGVNDKSGTMLLDSRHGDESEVRRGAEAIFATHAGITLDAALEQYHRAYEPDPMGPASRYE